MGNVFFNLATLIAIADKNNYTVKVSKHAKGCTWMLNTGFSEYTDNEVESLSNVYTQKCSAATVDPLVFEQPDNTDFQATFCCPAYFDNVRDKVFDLLSFEKGWAHTAKHGIDGLRQDKYDIVAMHVRRTDYLNFPDIFERCTLDYYFKAMSMFSSETHRFLVFSDDMEWCKENIKGEGIMYSEGFPAIEDLCIMAECQHFIIANSTFSWWGAWLAKSPDKRVIMPEKWFVKSHHPSTDTYQCEGWVQV